MTVGARWKVGGKIGPIAGLAFFFAVQLVAWPWILRQARMLSGVSGESARWLLALAIAGVMFLVPPVNHAWGGTTVFEGWRPIWDLGEHLQSDGVTTLNLQIALTILLCEWALLGLAVFAFSALSHRPVRIGHRASSPLDDFLSGDRMTIYSGYGVSREHARICEQAISANLFEPHGVDQNGGRLLIIRTAQQAFVVKVNVSHEPGPLGSGAIILSAVYPTDLDNVAAKVAELKQV